LWFNKETNNNFCKSKWTLIAYSACSDILGLGPGVTAKICHMAPSQDNQHLVCPFFKFRKENQEKRAQRGSKLPHLKSQKLPMYKAQTKSNSIVADKVQAVQIEKKKRPTG